MKQLLILISNILIGMSITAHAQELKRTEPVFSDYIPILKDAGYEVFSFDISSLKDDTYNIGFAVREYVMGELVPDPLEGAFALTNRDMISGYSKGYQQKIIEEGLAYDVEKDVFKLYEKMTVGISPSADSLKNVSFSIGKYRIGRDLPLKPMDAPGIVGKQFSYDTRPFKVDTISIGEFVPLVMLGTWWYDEDAQTIRFCGDEELAADMSSGMLKRIPHYYVIGVIVTR